MNISDRLSDYFNLSLSNIEKKLNLSNGYISNYKNGKIKNPSKLVQSLREMKSEDSSRFWIRKRQPDQERSF